jgi:hypothetical protein
MKREELERLLGGYAFGTLTSAERSELLRASLTDQSLFDALADEESLRDLLSDPATRRELLAALSPAEPERAHAFGWGWLRWASVGLAAAGVMVLTFVWTSRKNVEPLAQQEIAMNRPLPASVGRLPKSPVQAEPAPKPKQKPVIVSRNEDANRLDRLNKVEKDKEDAGKLTEKKEATKQLTDQRQVAQGVVGGVPGGLPSGAMGGVAQQAPLPAAAPPPPARAIAPSASSEFKLRAAKSAAPAVTALSCVLERQTAEGIWESVPTGASVAAQEKLRLAVESPDAGTLEVVGMDAVRVVVAASERAYLSLPTQSAGKKQLQILFHPASFSVANAPAEERAADTVRVKGLTVTPAARRLEIRFEVR